MEVINIDSSDEEDTSPVSAGLSKPPSPSAHKPISKLITQPSTLTNYDDDDNSVSSNDSIWDKQGLTTDKSSTVGNNTKSDIPANDSSDDEELEVIKSNKVHQAINDSNKVHQLKSTHLTTNNNNVNDMEDTQLKEAIRLSLLEEQQQQQQQQQQQKPSSIPNTATTKTSTQQQPNTVDSYLGKWKVVLLMDHREFGIRDPAKMNYLQSVQSKINIKFGSGSAEIVALPSADYLFVARLISHDNGMVIDERVFDMIIERKDVNDLAQGLIVDSKKYKPLSFFEAQMYKMQHSGVNKKLFILEGDEDDPSHFRMIRQIKFGNGFIKGMTEQQQQSNRLKRVKTTRLQIENGEWHGVDLLCTKNKHDTVKFLMEQLDTFKRSFDPLQPPEKTMEQLTSHIDGQMKDRTFHEYLRLTSIKGIGPVTAMAKIRGPQFGWDRSFICPSGNQKKIKSTGNERVTFWKETATEATTRHLKNSRAQLAKNKTSGGKYVTANRNTDSSSCALCKETVDIFENGIVSCNRVKDCGQVYHKACLEAQGYDISKDSGCVMCKGLSKFSTKTAKSSATKRKATTSPLSASKPKSSTKASSQSSKRQKTNNTKQTSTTPPSASAATITPSNSEEPSSSSTTEKRVYASKPPPPEKVYAQRSKTKPQPTATIIKRSSFDGNGCFSNPLNDGSSAALAALLNDDKQPPTKKRKKSMTKATALPPAKKTTKAATTTLPPPKLPAMSVNKDVTSCGVCNKPISAWLKDFSLASTESDIVSCNRISQCNGTFHRTCLAAKKIDIRRADGCIKCRHISLFTTTKSKKANNQPIVLDSDDDDVIVID